MADMLIIVGYYDLGYLNFQAIIIIISRSTAQVEPSHFKIFEHFPDAQLS